MDCPSEESMIRMKLEEVDGIKQLDFDIPNRKLTVFHAFDVFEVENAILQLNLGGKLLSTEETEQKEFETEKNQSRVLSWVLLINFLFFVIEMTTGWLSKSMGLVADSLDMLADAFVYGISLLAVGATVVKKKKIARLAGYFQLILALAGLVEVIRRFVSKEMFPDFFTMIVVSVMALMANSICLLLLQKSKGKEEAHMKASMIFTSNDIIINAGVIVAGLLVHWLQTGLPDLIIGATVFVIVVRGAIRILKLGK